MASSTDPVSRRGTLTDFKGSLSEVLLFDLYRQIYLSRQTGTLELTSDDVVRQISFRNGSVTFATTNCDSERLGSRLLSEGRITAEQLDSGLYEGRSGKRFGYALVEAGAISREDLDQCIRRHQSELAISALGWKRGSFRFSEMLPGEYEDVFVDLSTADIILEGTRRIEDPSLIRKLLGSPNRLLGFAGDPLLRFQTVSLTAQEGYLLSRFERPMSIDEVCRMSALGETATMKALLGFVLAGVLDYAETSDAGYVECAGATHPAAYQAKSQLPDVAESAPNIAAMNQILEADTLYDVLGVAPDCSLDQIREAYFQLTRQFHPDKWGRTVTSEVYEKAEKVYQSVEAAYQVLASPRQRARYDDEHSAAHGAKSQPFRDCRATIRVYAQDVARRSFEEGVRLFERRMYVAALEKLKEAVKVAHEMAPYRFYLAQTLARLPGRSREAEFHYCIAIHQAPWNEDFKKAYEKFKKSPLHHDRVNSLFVEALAEIDRAEKVAPQLREDGTVRGSSAHPPPTYQRRRC